MLMPRKKTKWRDSIFTRGRDVHVLLKLLKMLLLLSKLLLQLQQLFLLTHADCVVLVCLFALAECIAAVGAKDVRLVTFIVLYKLAQAGPYARV